MQSHTIRRVLGIKCLTSHKLYLTINFVLQTFKPPSRFLSTPPNLQRGVSTIRRDFLKNPKKYLYKPKSVEVSRVFCLLVLHCSVCVLMLVCMLADRAS